MEGAATDTAPAGLSPEQQLQQTRELLRLDDGQVSRLLPANLGPEGHAYRTGRLHELALTLRRAGLDAASWLHRPTRDSGPTPYQLMCSGHLGEVQTAATAVELGLSDPDLPMERLRVLN